MSWRSGHTVHSCVHVLIMWTQSSSGGAVQTQAVCRHCPTHVVAFSTSNMAPSSLRESRVWGHVTPFFCHPLFSSSLLYSSLVCRACVERGGRTFHTVNKQCWRRIVLCLSSVEFSYGISWTITYESADFHYEKYSIYFIPEPTEHSLTAAV